MKREIITVRFTEGGIKYVNAYHVDGFLYVHRMITKRRTLSSRWWVISHGPTGREVTGRVYRTRRQAAETAKALIKHLPEVAMKKKVGTFVNRNKRKVRNEIARCNALGWARTP